MEKLGIDNISKLTVAIATLGSGLEGIFADGKVDWKDASEIYSVIKPLLSLSDVDLSQVMPEIKDLDSDEITKLHKVFTESFDLADDKVEVIVETGLSYVVKAIELVKFVMSIVKK